MNGSFGKYIEGKRKAQGMTLRGLAAELGIAPAFMSDIEKGHRYPPNKEKLYELARILHLSEADTNTMFDLAAAEKENTVSPDLPEYIMNGSNVRVALRLARDKGIPDAAWQKVIDMLEAEETKESRSE
ncbi:MAG: helix-turn-helix transcriptional regulator [Paludibacteraceae bacterium]|nr:helix-turn-helix transcriptional regulator [Paludibacteraceae bacterium]